MKANPGGTIGPGDVVGRDQLIGALWQLLEKQSLHLTSERRIGKTTILRKMKAEAPHHTLCFMRDLEGLRTPQQLVEALYQDVEPFLRRADRALLRFQDLLSSLGGTQVGDVKLPQFAQHWKNLLSELVDDLLRADSGTVIFLWDELPLFLLNVAKEVGEAAAIEVLDVLRSLRQQREKVRMVFTGSVGLHQVIASLRRGMRYANDPTNDMRIVEVPPLTPQDGATLAALLIDGEGLTVEPGVADFARRVSEAAAHIPYYIHFLIARVKLEGIRPRADTAEEYVQALISDPNDPAHFHYYRERLRVYYPAEEEAIALASLDVVAGAPSPLAFGDLLNRVHHTIPTAKREVVRDTLTLLERDHYIIRTLLDGKYEFRYAIVRRWWKFHRN